MTSEEIGGASTWVARTTSSEVSGSGGSSSSTGSRLAQGHRPAPRHPPARSARPWPSPPRWRGVARGWRPCSRTSAGTRESSRQRRPGGTNHARDPGAGDQDQPGHEQEHREDVGADRRDQVRGHPQLALSHDPATLFKSSRVPELRRGNRAGTDAERSRRERQRDRTGQADGSGPQRPARRPHLARQHQPAADDERRRNDVSERAEHEPKPGDRAVSERPAVPTAVGDAAEQDPDRDQPEPEDVDVVRLEPDVGEPQRWAASQQRARRALGRRLLSLSGGHFGGTGFDVARRLPARAPARLPGPTAPPPRPHPRAPPPRLGPRQNSSSGAVPSAYRNDRLRTHPTRARGRGR